MKIIDKAEQEKLFSMYETPEHVQLHCNEVARVAGLIGEALNEKGYHLDIKSIRGAAMFHDIVRVHKDLDNKVERYWIRLDIILKLNLSAIT